MSWWQAAHAKAEKMGRAEHVPEMERAYRLNSKAGLGSDGKEGMEVVAGLSDRTLNLDVSTGQAPGKASAKMWLQVPSEAQRAGTAPQHRPELGGTCEFEARQWPAPVSSVLPLGLLQADRRVEEQ